MALTPIVPANNAPVTGEVTTPDTFDLHSVNLSAGVPYTFVAEGTAEGKGTLTDVNMSIGGLNASGDFVPLITYEGTVPVPGLFGGLTINPLDPVITFVPQVTGSYAIAVGSNDPTATGTYLLGVAPGAIAFQS